MKTKLAKNKKEIKIDPSLDPWQEKRRDRIAFIMKLLSSEKEVDVDPFFGFMSTEYGIRRQTLKEYLTGLQDYGVIEIGDGKIKWLGKGESERTE